jgi:hypothetical protein
MKIATRPKFFPSGRVKPKQNRALMHFLNIATGMKGEGLQIVIFCLLALARFADWFTLRPPKQVRMPWPGNNRFFRFPQPRPILVRPDEIENLCASRAYPLSAHFTANLMNTNISLDLCLPGFMM